MTTQPSDEDLYRRGAANCLASWEAYARGSDGAAVLRFASAVAAVFPDGPERTLFNNALLAPGLDAEARAGAVADMESAYAAAGVDRFAAWVHEADAPMRADLDERGYRVDTTTRAMGMAVDDVRTARPELDLAPRDWDAYLDFLERDGAPAGLLSGVAPDVFTVRIACLDGQPVAAALAFDVGDDCGIYNVGTLERARRRGLGTALTALLVHEAADRGCRTATLQSTAMGERVYAAVGFRDVGGIVEYVPQGSPDMDPTA
jgi:ribosomal protein S18 acetylase RimI-like enzyme